jgi:polar amino acid transport system substrate-binding protein
MPKCLMVFLLWLMTAQSAFAADRLKMLVPDYPPYSYKEYGRFSGVGYDAVAAIMADADIDFTVQLVPHFGRALMAMRSNTADGFFLATESKERNEVAVFSNPVMMANWSWVWLKNRTDLAPGSVQFKNTAAVSAQMNSHAYHWLVQQGFQVTAGTNEISGLLNLLKYKRVDAILLPELTAKFVLEQQQSDLEQFNFQQEISLPYAIYINKLYLQKHPEFMTKLNAAIARYHSQQVIPAATQFH